MGLNGFRRMVMRCDGKNAKSIVMALLKDIHSLEPARAWKAVCDFVIVITSVSGS
jgi:hypothetical protein